MIENKGYPDNFFRTNNIVHCISGLWLFSNKNISTPRRCLQYLWTAFLYLNGGWFLILEFMCLNETLKDVNKFIRQLGLLLFCLYSFAGLSAHIASEIQINKEKKGEYFEGNETCSDYVPYYFVIPFPVYTKTECELSFIFMHYCLNAFAWCGACYDGLYAALLNCLTAQLDVLCDAMSTIRPRVLRRLRLPKNTQVFYDDDLPMLEEALYQELLFLTKHLMALLRVADDLEAIFNMITLGQTVTSLMVFASCLLVSTSVPVNSPEFFTRQEYFICMLIQLSIFCWFGSTVTRASERIIFAIYNSDWFGSSKRFKRSMLTTMCRMQRPIYFTIGKFCPLTLNALIMVCKGSFSYYTVFKTVGE